MPQMVNGRMPDPSLTVVSERTQAAGYYGLGTRTHAVQYSTEGSFVWTCTVQVSQTPNPSELDWQDLPNTKQTYVGNETTGAAGISGGFSGAVSRPIHSDLKEFTGNYAWVRVRLDICRGTLQAVKLNF